MYLLWKSYTKYTIENVPKQKNKNNKNKKQKMLLTTNMCTSYQL